MQHVITKEAPPTYFKTDRFTSSFQGIVDSYGMARYRELNAGVFTLISFPFLFGIMFGDVGHGVLLTVYGALLIAFEERLSRGKLNELVAMTFGGRYLILLMGIFSIYCGFIYNEAFAIPMTVAGSSRWVCGEAEQLDVRNPGCTSATTTGLEPGGNFPYPFGFDPVWHGTKTELTFTNSVKMKMAILLGVLQMDLGIVCSLFNHLYWRDFLSIIAEFIPQMVFLNSLFGYLCFLVVFKWVNAPVLETRWLRLYQEAGLD